MNLKMKTGNQNTSKNGKQTGNRADYNHFDKQRADLVDKRYSLQEQNLQIRSNQSSDIHLGDQAWSSSNQRISKNGGANYVEQLLTPSLEALTMHPPGDDVPAVSGKQVPLKKYADQSSYNSSNQSQKIPKKDIHQQNVQQYIGQGIVAPHQVHQLQFVSGQDLHLTGQSQKLNEPKQNYRSTSYSRNSRKSLQKNQSYKSNNQVSKVDNNSGISSTIEMQNQIEPQQMKNPNIAQIIDEDLEKQSNEQKRSVENPSKNEKVQQKHEKIQQISQINVNIAQIYNNQESTKQELKRSGNDKIKTGQNSTQQLSSGKESQINQDEKNVPPKSVFVTLDQQMKEVSATYLPQAPTTDSKMANDTKLPVHPKENDYFEETFKNLGDNASDSIQIANNQPPQKDVSNTIIQFKALEVKTGNLNSLDFQKSKIHQESRNQIPLKHFSTNTKRENTLKKRQSVEQQQNHMISQQNSNTQQKQMAINSDTTRLINEHSQQENSFQNQQFILKSSDDNSMDKQVFNEMFGNQPNYQQDWRKQLKVNAKSNENMQIMDNGSQNNNDSIFNDIEQIEDTNQTSAKLLRLDSQIENHVISTENQTKNYNFSNRITNLHSKNYSSLMLSDEKDYGMDIHMKVERKQAFNSKSSSNLPLINQTRNFRPEEQADFRGVPNSSILSQINLQIPSPSMQNRYQRNKYSNVYSMQNLLQPRDFDSYSQYSLLQMKIDKNLNKNWTSSQKRDPSTSMPPLSVSANELRELAKDRKQAVMTYLEDRNTQEKELERASKYQQSSQLSMALNDLTSKYNQKRGKTFFSRGNFVSSVSQQTLPQIEKGSRSPSYHSNQLSKKQKPLVKQNQNTSQLIQDKTYIVESREIESENLPKERAIALKNYYKQLNAYESTIDRKRYGNSALEQSNNDLMGTVMSDRNRLIRSLLSKKKSYIPLEKDYTELNKRQNSLQTHFQRNSVTHPYKIDPKIQQLISKKTLLEQWMDLVNDGRDPRVLLQGGKSVENPLPSQIQIMKLMMDDEEHICKRFEGQDHQEDVQPSEKLIKLWRQKLTNQPDPVDIKEIGGDKIKSQTEKSQKKRESVAASLGNLIRKKQSKEQPKKKKDDEIDPEILIVDRMCSQIPSLMPLQNNDQEVISKSSKEHWMDDRSNSVQDKNATQKSQSQTSQLQKSRTSAILGARSSAYNDNEHLEMSQKNQIARSTSSIGLHYKNIREKCMDARLNFFNKLKVLEDRMVDRVSKKSAVLVYSQYVNKSMEENRIDKHGSILRLKSIENTSSRGHTANNSRKSSPKNEYNKIKKPLKLEDIVQLKEQVDQREDNRIEQIAYLQQLHKQHHDHKESVIKELVRSSSPKRKNTLRKMGSPSVVSGRSGDSPKSHVKKSGSTVKQAGILSSLKQTPGPQSQSALELGKQQATFNNRSSTFLQKIKNEIRDKIQEDVFDYEFFDKQYRFKPRNASVENTFIEVGKSNQSDIKFCARFKSYLDVAGVPTEYYTDAKMARYLEPKHETDPLKKLLEPEDKYEIKVPPIDRNKDLINRLSQLTTLQQSRKNAENSTQEEHPTSALDLFCEQHHTDNTIGLIQKLREDSENKWHKDKLTHPRYKKNFLNLRKGKEGLNKLNNGPFRRTNMQQPFNKEAKDNITGEYKYIIPEH